MQVVPPSPLPAGPGLEPCGAGRFVLPDPRPLDGDDPVAVARESRRRAAGLLDGVVDAHVHLFPDRFYRALWRWFDAHGWEIRFRAGAAAVLGELARVGTRRLVALVYAHRPGVARFLNGYLADLCRAAPQVIGVGTVLPGEPDAPAIVREAIGRHGLRGIKLHCHVQQLAIDDPRVLAVLSACQELGVPAVVHAGREPATAAYGVHPHTICHVSRTARVLEALPRLRLVVPHVGADEYPEYLALLAQHEHLYLDTSMACAEYFGSGPDWGAVGRWSERILYGTDFPLVPYEADRELRVLARRITADAALHRLLRGTAEQVWGPA